MFATIGGFVSATLQDINCAIISWLRFKKQFQYVCTEADFPKGYRADILASNGTMLYEFEIKTSISDLRHDFRDKATKHDAYLGKSTASAIKILPNYFSYAIPSDLVEAAEKVIPVEYGIISFTSSWLHPSYGAKVVRKSKKFHSNPVHPGILNGMIRRMGSEIANWHQAARAWNVFQQVMNASTNDIDAFEDLPEVL